MAEEDLQRDDSAHETHAEADKKPSTVRKLVGKVTAALRADDDMQAVLDAFALLDPDAIEKCTVDEARVQPTPADAVRLLVQQRSRQPNVTPATLVTGVSSRDIEIPGAATSLRARVYTPEAGAGPLPLIVYFHGGGWVIADLDVYDGGARGLAKEAQAIVVSVDYRRAPEARFPAAWDDALAAYRWALGAAASLNADPARVALAGESAGGCLAIATAITIRQQAELPPPCHVLAIYPVAQTGSLSTPSYIENALAVPLNRAMLPWFLEQLLRSDADKTDPRLDLVNAKLGGLPAVTLISAHLDPLRSDSAMLEDALHAAGVSVERRDYAGVTHEFFGMAAVVDKARQAQRYAGQRLRGSFAAIAPPLA